MINRVRAFVMYRMRPSSLRAPPSDSGEDPPAPECTPVSPAARSPRPAQGLVTHGCSVTTVARIGRPVSRPGSLVFRGPDDRDLADGRTENDRWVFAVYVTRPRGRIRVLTARDMTEGERRLDQRKRRERS